MSPAANWGLGTSDSSDKEMSVEELPLGWRAVARPEMGELAGADVAYGCAWLGGTAGGWIGESVGLGGGGGGGSASGASARGGA